VPTISVTCRATCRRRRSTVVAMRAVAVVASAADAVAAVAAVGPWVGDEAVEAAVAGVVGEATGPRCKGTNTNFVSSCCANEFNLFTSTLDYLTLKRFNIQPGNH
jgi:hypothetical protein